MVGCWYTPSLPATIVSPSRICREHKFRGFAGVGLLGSSTRSVPTPMLPLAPSFVEDNNNNLLYRNPLIRPTAAQHADPLPKPVLCVHRVAARNPEPAIDPAPPASPLSEPIVAPTEPLLLNLLSLPPSRLGRHHRVTAAPPAAHVLTQPSIRLRQSPSSTTRIKMSLGKLTT
jgi:hypothetical protein